MPLIFQVLIEIALAIAMLILGNLFWQFPKRSRFLLRTMSDPTTLEKLLTKAYLDNPPDRIVKFSPLLNNPVSPIMIGAWAQADKVSERRALIYLSIPVGAVAIGSYYLGVWYLAINAALFLLPMFFPISSYAQTSALDHIFTLGLMLYRWHGQNPKECVEFVGMAYSIRPIFEAVVKKAIAPLPPASELSYAIMGAAVNCRDGVKDLIKSKDEKDRITREMYIFFEFLYFFMHLAMRAAFDRMTQPQLEKLRTDIGPDVATVTIETCFGHWPDNLKKKIRGEFFDNLNRAECEYSECTKLDSKLEGNERLVAQLTALLEALAAHISDFAVGTENDTAVTLPVAKIVNQECQKMRLSVLVDNLVKA